MKPLKLIQFVTMVLLLLPVRISWSQESQPASGMNLFKDLNLSGFIDASYSYNNVTGDNSFNFDEAEFDLQKALGEVGNVRADLEYLGYEPESRNFAWEQAYISLKIPGMENSGIIFGKFNSPMGCEAMDPPEKIFYSYTMLCNYSLPSNLTGIGFTNNFLQSFDIMAFVVNGWDQDKDVNGQKTYGGRLGYSYGELLWVGFSAIRGSEREAENDLMTVFDIDFSLSPISGISFGGDILHGRNRLSDDSLGQNTISDWVGYSIFTHLALNEWLGFSGRYENLRDNNGFLFESAQEEFRQAVSLGPVVSLPYGVKCLLECRVDFADKAVFASENGSLEKTDFNIGFESVYSF